MLSNKINKIKKEQFSEGWLKSIRPSLNFKDWELFLEPSPVLKPKELKIILKNCLLVNFKGFNYFIEKFSSKKISIIDWGEIKNSQLLKEFFSQSTSQPWGTPAKNKSLKEKFHHIYFLSFEVSIEVICKDIKSEALK